MKKIQNSKIKIQNDNLKLKINKFLVLFFCFIVFLIFWSNSVFAATKTKKPYIVKKSRWIFGTSWQGRPLWAYSFGKGKNITLYLGGVHSGVERGAVQITNSWLSYLQNHKKIKKIVPKKHKVIIIPNLNPDGWTNYTRENTHYVDLNRNFSVNWQMWGNLWSAKVYGGPKPFSEPESIALKNLMKKEFKSQIGIGRYNTKSTKLVSYHMGTNQVFSPKIDGKLDLNSLKFAKFYNNFARYPANYSFDYYHLSGEIGAWFAKTFQTRAITVEMGAYEEFEKNRPAMKKVIKY
ncbi:MAG: M14 family zinc carboxypeptidase [Patescibacteria group bacterium]